MQQAARNRAEPTDHSHILKVEHRDSMKRFRRSVDVFFALAAIASLALLSSFLMGGGSLSPPMPSVSVTKKPALFLLSNAILLFLAADYSCCFAIGAAPAGERNAAAARDPGDVVVRQQARQHHQEAEVQQLQPDNMTSSEAPDHEAHSFTLEEPTCGTARDELDRLDIGELNRKFDEFIQSRRIKWIKEEEEEEEEEAFLRLQQV